MTDSTHHPDHPGDPNRNGPVAFVYHENYLLHEHHPTHPERRERLTYTLDQLEEEGVFDFPLLDVIEPDPATEEEMRLVHRADYLKRLKNMSERGHGSLSMDTHVSEHLWEQALLAAGGVMRAGELVVEGTYPRTYVMSRPGGHHAFSDHGHGFCFTNNSAVAIRHLQRTYDDVDRVLVWDWDAHHCDGTQSIFYDDPSVLVISTHQDGRSLFPGTGFIDETGTAEGVGYNVNVPLPAMTGDEAYMRVVEEIFKPVAEQYGPDFFFIEAGQDNHYTDPITNLGVTAQGYTRLVEAAVDTAERLTSGRFMASQAGGYGIEGGLPYTNTGVIAAMAELDTSCVREPGQGGAPEGADDIGPVIEQVQSTHADHWEF